MNCQVHQTPRALFIPVICILIMIIGCAHVSTSRRIISISTAPAALGSYSQGVMSGETLYLSGQLGIEPSSGQLAEGGVEAETKQIFSSCKAILTEAGLSLSDVVQVQVFLIDIGDFSKMNSIYSTYFQKNPPARATVAVAGLARGARIEIMMTAVKHRD